MLFDARRGTANADHRRILAACRAGAAELAAREAQLHILRAHRNMFAAAGLEPGPLLAMVVALADIGFDRDLPAPR
jgi:DNA-binding GntR family transcriptional regulator